MLTLTDELTVAFNVDGAATSQFKGFSDCKRAAATITRNLDALLEAASR